jgi:glycosyltransferase involved in cell wall biosynthesis
MSANLPLLACTGALPLGGSTTFLLNLGKSIRSRGLDFAVVSMAENNEMAADFAAAGVTVECVPARGLIYEDRIQRAYRAIAARRPAAVLACLGSDSFEPLRLVPPGTARLGIIQSDDPPPYEMSRHFAPWLDAMVGVSETICAKLRADAAFHNARIEHIPYGIQFEPETPRSARDPASPLKLIYLGRIIEEQKRVSRLAELVRLLTSRAQRFEFTLAGSGPELPALMEALRNYPNVHFLGEVPNTETRALLRSQDVQVILSDFEGLPLSLLEAMGEGVVPVVSDIESGMRQVVTAETGVRVPIGDVRAAADAIAALARDPARLAALSVSGARLVRTEYSAARMGSRFLDLASALSKPVDAWPAEVSVPAPMIVSQPWLYRGLARRVRRALKKFRPS